MSNTQPLPAGQVSIPDAMRAAIGYHQAGHHADAERVYRAVLEAAPDNFDALHLLGVLCAQRGHPGEGADLLGRAVKLQPQAADVRANLANVLQSLGRGEEALAHVDQALAQKPGNAGIQNIRAGILLDLTRFDAALAACDLAIAGNPAMPEAHYHRGVALQALGRHQEAIASYDRAIAINKDFAAACNNRGNALSAVGRHAEALASLDRVTALAPRYAGAWTNRASVLRALGRHADAVDSADRAIALQPDLGEAHAHRGAALRDMGRYDDAIASLDRALTVFERTQDSRSQRVDVLHARATALHLARRYDEALAAYDRVLATAPEHLPSLNDRAGVLREQGRFEEAIAGWQRVLAVDPGNAEAHHHCGSALYELGRDEEAVAAYDRALALRPDYGQALHNRAAALSRLMRYDEALASSDRLLAIDPDYAEAHHNRGSALSALGRFVEAAAAYDRALALRPGFVPSLQNRASVLAYLGRHDEAARDFAQVLAYEPDYAYAHGPLLSSRLHCCDWREYDARLARLTAGALDGSQVSDPFVLAITLDSAPALLAGTRTFVRDKVRAAAPLWNGERYAHERIRVAYLSADFHEHATAFLMAGLFERHDRTRFETIALSFGPTTTDPMRVRLERAFDRFLDVRTRTDREIAKLVRELEVDIAVDLKGYTFDSRPDVFAMRPAPVQVNYLGYPGTMAADFIDYIVADEVLIPPEEQANYTERVVTLPDSYQANDDTRVIGEATPARRDEGLPDEGFVFCSFNNSYKITPAVFDVWMRLLAQVPGSVLWLLEGNAIAPANLRREARARGIAPERLVFAPRRGQREHLARHRLADLFLDTLPVNAHTTASDALWSGLPIVTCLGRTFAGRVAGSLLRAAGLPELVTASLPEYEALALALAQDPARLAGVKAKLAAALPRCALYDTDRFRRHLEAAYVTMWERQQRGEPPAAFAVTPLS